MQANEWQALRRSSSDRSHAAVTTQLERTNVVFDGWGIMMVWVVEKLGLDILIGKRMLMFDDFCFFRWVPIILSVACGVVWCGMVWCGMLRQCGLNTARHLEKTCPKPCVVNP